MRLCKYFGISLNKFLEVYVLPVVTYVTNGNVTYDGLPKTQMGPTSPRSTYFLY